MAGPTPSGFDRDTVLAGLRTAMTFGAPSKTADRATFFMPRTGTVLAPHDELNVPFDPDERPVLNPVVKYQVACAIEYNDAHGKLENFGIIAKSRIKITLLDPDYQVVKGFEYVVIAGEKYLYRKTEPPVALGSLDVWTVHAEAEDEA